MTSPAFPIDPESLMADSAWLRALARGIVRDAGTADDLAQEAWVAAMRSKRVKGVEQRTWLAGVLRNVAWKRARTDARRGARELRGARTESLAATDELVARAEMQKALSEAVLALPEPFRTTILLRYLEELDGAEIARRLGVPEGTVRWRVMRGLELLRTDLEKRRGTDWLHSCALVAGLMRVPETAAVATTAGAGVLSIQSAAIAAGLTVAGTTAAIGTGWIEAPWDDSKHRTASGGGAPEFTTTNSPPITDEDSLTSEVEDEGGARATRTRIPLAVRTETQPSEGPTARASVSTRRLARGSSASTFDASNFEIETQRMFVCVAATDLEGTAPTGAELDLHAVFSADGEEFLQLSDEEREQFMLELENRVGTDAVQYVKELEGQAGAWCSMLPYAGVPFLVPANGSAKVLDMRVLGVTKELRNVRITTTPASKD